MALTYTDILKIVSVGEIPVSKPDEFIRDILSLHLDNNQILVISKFVNCHKTKDYYLVLLIEFYGMIGHESPYIRFITKKTTPWKIAAEECLFEILEHILEKNPDQNVDELLDIGTTALFNAVYCENIDAAKMLLQRGANVNHSIGLGYTVLFYYIQYIKKGDDTKMVRLLFEYGADINMRSDLHKNDRACLQRVFIEMNLQEMYDEITALDIKQPDCN